jgi:phosphoribosylanthranilate isomerase
MIIKVCGITRREDALAAAEAGASALGFIFYRPSPRYVTPQHAAKMVADLAVSKVGVFVDEAPETIAETMHTAGLDIAQIYGEAPIRGLRVWRAFRGPVTHLQIANAEAVLLDSPQTGVPFDWRLARGVAEKVIIAGGLDASNVGEAIRIAEPWGVDASSRLESAPGIKDHVKVRHFVQAALAACEVHKE